MMYNLGCGRERLEGYVNVDINPGENVDVVCDIRTELSQFPENTADKIVCFHTLEHIERDKLPRVLYGMYKMLKPGGELIVSFPDFEICSKYFLENKLGMADFWEKTIFGRHDFPHDNHLSALTTQFVSAQMHSMGFKVTHKTFEPAPNDCNAVIFATKVVLTKSYREALKEI